MFFQTCQPSNSANYILQYHNEKKEVIMAWLLSLEISKGGVGRIDVFQRYLFQRLYVNHQVVPITYFNTTIEKKLIMARLYFTNGQ